VCFSCGKYGHNAGIFSDIEIFNVIKETGSVPVSNSVRVCSPKEMDFTTRYKNLSMV